MGCPDAIVAHLAGLQDVEKISFDVSSRVFEMVAKETFDKNRLIKELLEVSKKENREFTLDSYEEVS
ncbi:hypothetical protein OWM07_05015 [Deferribacter thermophilus]|uniref:hypothetical protein n=1 Tax=Deferribacter thermophilus TaxID=53573 RepID=UPI003C18CBA8